MLQALPIQIPSSYFDQINALFFDFVWAHKRPRLARRLLTLPKLYGGLAIPDLRKYYYATHLTRLIDWNRHQTTKLWTRLEQTQSDIPLNRAPWCYDRLPSTVKTHPLIGVTIRTCAALFTRFRLISLVSPLRPILGTPEFTPGYTDPVFQSLRDLKYFQASHFILDGKWPTISELMSPSGPFHLDFWRAAQLNHFLKTLPSPRSFDQTLTTYKTYCSEEDTMPHALSATYQLLITPLDDFRLHYIDEWERDLQCTLTTRQKQNILHFTYRSSICTKMQETNYKILTRWYNTPAKIHKIFPSSSDRCWRCQNDRGTILHIFWTCPLLERFWRTVQNTIQKFTDRQIANDPAFFLLHAAHSSSKVYKKSLIRHLLDAAKACIPLMWKSTQPPSVGTWVRKVEDIKTMEDLILTARHQNELFSRTWTRWNMFIYSEEGQSLLGMNL